MMRLFQVAAITSVLDIVGAAAASIARICNIIRNQLHSVIWAAIRLLHPGHPLPR
ncbi:hypothetical protein MTX26_07165 [Bradyrhizobium sp. ISRA443]|uniref:hypothetical protein n=1 Tax=unclassified Bradyrhizobium TaxID=2631580 RepID=UPI0024783909|nr:MULTISPECIES: hypothetical protein [unclassified Bradyrhizobium]WGR95558.1 hypothetical protein MTX20_17415 [Bradyrhizobium sp. ISRA435]WGS00609.1 hypothetical protein MTX23_07160 [Bradyrhizobium sp. ISRA436]WGS07498.1 hypothetical protein MTX18_07160 [Bradyrhizobium sp. ISRA437]WGS14384.1 hypothetical protein MTX26_07165 [Bradyrhizobium sp. ISRA443]